MPSDRALFILRAPVLILIFLAAVPIAHAQGAKQTAPQSPVSEGDHIKERNEWFFRGRLVRGKSAAELRRRAYQAKLKMRAQYAAARGAAKGGGLGSLSTGSWIALGPVPLASDATGNGTQDYHQVSGRATAVAIDPADPTGNTVYVGGAQSGVWNSTNAANPAANSVAWTPVSDDQATLSIGAIAIQPGNSDPAQTVILAATGEADNASDSYFGLGILLSANAGSTWSLISTANNGALSFAGLGGTRMAFSTASGQTNTVVSAMAASSQGVVDGAVTANTMQGLYTSLECRPVLDLRRAGRSRRRHRRYFGDIGHLQRQRRAVRGRDSLPRILFLAGRSELDPSRGTARRRGAQRHSVPAALHIQ